MYGSFALRAGTHLTRQWQRCANRNAMFGSVQQCAFHHSPIGGRRRKIMSLNKQACLRKNKKKIQKKTCLLSNYFDGPQGILLLFVDFDSEFPQAFLLHIFQVLQDVFKVLLCTVSQLNTPTRSGRESRVMSKILQISTGFTVAQLLLC